MFKIPESFKLGSISYRVKMFVERGGGMGLGQHDGKNSVIEIAQDVSPDRQAKTFVHESLHGIIEQYGVDIPDDQEEKIVSQLCTGITEMIDQIVEFNVTTADWFKSQANFVGRASDYKRIGKLANLIAEYYKKEGNGCGGNCHLILDDGNLEDSDIQFCKGYCAHANDDDGLYIMREMLSLNPEERQKVYDTASVLTNPRYTNNLDNTKEKS